MLMAEWLEMWYNTYVDGNEYSPSTRAMYRRSIDAVPDWLGSIELASVTPIDCYRHIRFRAVEHPRAAQLDRIMLTRALLVAVKCGLRQPIVLDDDTCPTPRHVAKKQDVLDARQLALYMRTAPTAAPVTHALLLMCACGLRRGEALGMTWDCIDLQAGVMQVKQQRLRVSGNYLVVPPKTSAGKRMVCVSPALAAALRAMPRQLGGWVVDTTPERLQREHLAVIRAAGLPHVTIHGLRHSIATVAAAAGMPIKLLQAELGHSSYKITADLYADHVQDSAAAMRAVYERSCVGG